VDLATAADLMGDSGGTEGLVKEEDLTEGSVKEEDLMEVLEVTEVSVAMEEDPTVVTEVSVVREALVVSDHKHQPADIGAKPLRAKTSAVRATTKPLRIP